MRSLTERLMQRRRWRFPGSRGGDSLTATGLLSSVAIAPRQWPLVMLWTAPLLASRCTTLRCSEDRARDEPPMKEITTVGLDIAKSLF
jgi:hypothetical protein